jgi:hypothetical protein
MFSLNDVGFLGSLYRDPWTPAAITTALWLDAADSSTVTTVSSAVSQWNDKSGNGRNAAQGTAGNRPAYQSAAQNGLNAVRFTAASSHFLTAGTTSTWNFLHDGTDSSAFIVARVRSTGDNPGVIHTYFSTLSLSSSDIGLSFLYLDSSSNDAINVSINKGVPGQSPASITVPDTITPGTYNIMSCYLDANNATAANRIKARINGGTEIGSNIATFTPSASNSTDVLNIGSGGVGNTARGFYFTGDMCEILLLNTQPGTTDRQRIEGYLAHKWGLTANLPADHPFKSNAPTL